VRLSLCWWYSTSLLTSSCTFCLSLKPVKRIRHHQCHLSGTLLLDREWARSVHPARNEALLSHLSYIVPAAALSVQHSYSQTWRRPYLTLMVNDLVPGDVKPVEVDTTCNSCLFWSPLSLSSSNNQDCFLGEFCTQRCGIATILRNGAKESWEKKRVRIRSFALLLGDSGISKILNSFNVGSNPAPRTDILGYR